MEGVGYGYGVVGDGNGGIDQYCVCVYFQCLCCMVWDVDFGVDYYWDCCLFDNNFQYGFGFQFLIGVDWCIQWYYCCVVYFFQLFIQYWIGVVVGQYYEFFVDQQFCCFQGFNWVGQQLVGVWVDFQFQLMGIQGFLCQVGGKYCFFCCFGV